MKTILHVLLLPHVLPKGVHNLLLQFSYYLHSYLSFARFHRRLLHHHHQQQTHQMTSSSATSGSSSSFGVSFNSNSNNNNYNYNHNATYAALSVTPDRRRAASKVLGEHLAHNWQQQAGGGVSNGGSA